MEKPARTSFVIAILFLLAAIGILLSSYLRLQSTPTLRIEPIEKPANSPIVDPALENARIQRDRLDFDKGKSVSDADREERKIFWTALATAVPLIAGILVILAGFVSQYRQTKNQFELKTAEIIFQGTTPQAVESRGKAMKAIFGGYLSKGFLSKFKPEDYGGYKEPSEERRVFLEHILKYPNRKAEIVSLWFLLFPGDYEWLVRVDPAQFKDSELPEIKALLAQIPNTESNSPPGSPEPNRDQNLGS